MEAASLSPFKAHWLDRNGVRLHYLDEGEGDPVLLLHGNPTWSYLYRHVIAGLRERMRLVAPDYPGFGLSEVPPGYGYRAAEHGAWVQALIDHLGLTRILLVGQDWGGPIGLSLAVQRPDRFAGILMLNSWCWPADFRMRLFSWLMGSRWPGRYLTIRKNLFVTALLPAAICHKEKVDQRLRQAYEAPFPTDASREGVWVFPNEIRTAAAWLAQVERQLPRLRNTPVQLVWGMKDPAFGQARYLARWCRLFPHAHVERLDDAGHYVQEDRPDRIIAAIQTLRSIEGTTASRVRGKEA